jgi:dienelactone hydrolase
VVSCSEPPGEIDLGKITLPLPEDTDGPDEIDRGKITLPGVKDCPIDGKKLPFVVISHSNGDWFGELHDTAETLADAGFVVASVTRSETSRFDHPDASRFGRLSSLAERPTDIKRLIDFMLAVSPAATKIDPQRIGFYGFSLGGFTGLVLIGVDPDWATASAFCQFYGLCELIRGKDLPALPRADDARIKAAVLVDPGPIFFTAGGIAELKCRSSFGRRNEALRGSGLTLWRKNCRRRTSITWWQTPGTLPSCSARQSWRRSGPSSAPTHRASTAPRSTSNSMPMCSRSSGRI